MSERINRSGWQVAKVLDDFISSEALPGTGVDEDAFWAGVAGIVRELTSENRELLKKRDTLQKEIDRYHLTRKGQTIDPDNAKVLNNLAVLFNDLGQVDKAIKYLNLLI